MKTFVTYFTKVFPYVAHDGDDNNVEYADNDYVAAGMYTQTAMAILNNDDE